MDNSKKVTSRINCLSIHILCQQYCTLLMYGILRVNNLPSGNILTFVWSCHEMACHLYKYATNVFNGLKFELICHKCLQRLCKCVNWHQTICLKNMCIQYKIFVRRMAYCMRQACIGSPLNNFSQKTLLRISLIFYLQL